MKGLTAILLSVLCAGCIAPGVPKTGSASSSLVPARPFQLVIESIKCNQTSSNDRGEPGDDPEEFYLAVFDKTRLPTRPRHIPNPGDYFRYGMGMSNRFRSNDGFVWDGSVGSFEPSLQNYDRVCTVEFRDQEGGRQRAFEPLGSIYCVTGPDPGGSGMQLLFRCGSRSVPVIPRITPDGCLLDFRLYDFGADYEIRARLRFK